MLLPALRGMVPLCPVISSSRASPAGCACGTPRPWPTRRGQAVCGRPRSEKVPGRGRRACGVWIGGAQALCSLPPTLQGGAKRLHRLAPHTPPCIPRTSAAATVSGALTPCVPAGSPLCLSHATCLRRALASAGSARAALTTGRCGCGLDMPLTCDMPAKSPCQRGQCPRRTHHWTMRLRT